jgi:phospholipid transport system substrate-binding protein
MSDALSHRSLLSAVFSRPASRLSGLMVLAVGLAFGIPPALAETDVRVEPAAVHLGPLELVKSSLSRVLAIVQSQSTRETQEGRRGPEIRQVAAEMFDFDDISRRILAQHWNSASPQEQDEFVRLFTEMLERVYLSSITSYPLASITFQSETIDGSYAQVQSRMTGRSGRDMSVEYRLFDSEGRWAVYDIAVDGVSLVSSYRSQFNSILRRASFAQLLERLQSRRASAANTGEAQGQ